MEIAGISRNLQILSATDRMQTKKPGRFRSPFERSAGSKDSRNWKFPRAAVNTRCSVRQTNCRYQSPNPVGFTVRSAANCSEAENERESKGKDWKRDRRC